MASNDVYQSHTNTNSPHIQTGIEFSDFYEDREMPLGWIKKRSERRISFHHSKVKYCVVQAQAEASMVEYTTSYSNLLALFYRHSPIVYNLLLTSLTIQGWKPE